MTFFLVFLFLVSFFLSSTIFLFPAIPFRQLQRPDRLPRQNSRQSECDGSLLSDFMSNASQQPGISITHRSNVDKKLLMSTLASTTNSNNSTPVAISIPFQSINSHHRNNHPDETSSRQTPVRSRSGESKRVERTTRKECYRLGRRKLLFEKRRKASDCALFFALIGLLLMVLEQELTMANVYSKVKIIDENLFLSYNKDRREKNKTLRDTKHIQSYLFERLEKCLVSHYVQVILQITLEFFSFFFCFRLNQYFFGEKEVLSLI